MSKIRLHGSSSGYTEIAPVAASGNNTLTLPNDGTIISQDSNGAVGVTSVHTTNITATGIATITTAKIGAGVTISESGIEASGIGITVANINGTQIGGRRNKIINGAMQVAQRGTSFTVSDAYTLDRYKFKISGGGACTITQDSTTPDDFSYSYKVDVTTADTSVASGDHGVIMHVVEGYDFAPANFGSSAAKTCTLSFYVRSNKTGTYGVAFQNASQNRSCIQEYTINSADTWERKSITIPADTGGSWNTTNGVGLKVTWGLMGGSTYATSTLGSYNGSNVFLTSNQVNLFDNTSNEWYMTGAQLEIGTQATAFEHRSVGEELALCQRYYEELHPRLLVLARYSHHDGSPYAQYHFKVEKRAAPTCTSSGTFQTSTGYSGAPSFSDTLADSTDIYGANSVTAGGILYLHNNSNGICHFDAEL